MCTFRWFDDLPVLGRLAPEEAAARLREIGETEAADALETRPTGTTRTFGVRDLWPFRDRPWQHTAHAFGYLAPSLPRDDPLPIRHAGNINADKSLKKARLKITLDRLRVAVALTRSIAKRNQNVPVQDFYLGLDFTNIATGARLAEGSYLAVQIPETLHSAWDWSDWVYHPAKGQVVNKYEPTQLIPYNYVIFAVSRYEE